MGLKGNLIVLTVEPYKNNVSMRIHSLNSGDAFNLFEYVF